MATNLWPPATRTGERVTSEARELPPVPSPHCPAWLAPVHHASPSTVRPHVWPWPAVEGRGPRRRLFQRCAVKDSRQQCRGVRATAPRPPAAICFQARAAPAGPPNGTGVGEDVVELMPSCPAPFAPCSHGKRSSGGVHGGAYTARLGEWRRSRSMLCITVRCPLHKPPLPVSPNRGPASCLSRRMHGSSLRCRCSRSERRRACDGVRLCSAPSTCGTHSRAPPHLQSGTRNFRGPGSPPLAARAWACLGSACGMLGSWAGARA